MAVIKLICPECQNDELFVIKENAFDKWFQCDYCQKKFTFQEAQWEKEDSNERS